MPACPFPGRAIDLIGGVRRSLESWWHQPTFLRVDHKSLGWVLVWVTVWHRLQSSRSWTCAKGFPCSISTRWVEDLLVCLLLASGALDTAHLDTVRRGVVNKPWLAESVKKSWLGHAGAIFITRGECSGCRTVTRELVTLTYFSVCLHRSLVNSGLERGESCVGDTAYTIILVCA